MGGTTRRRRRAPRPSSCAASTSGSMPLRQPMKTETAGTRLALPSQTMYVTRDDGLDEGRKRAAEQQVAEWTEAGELPFPDMSQAQREALAGTLDYPPTGSVERAAAEEKD